MNDKHDWIAGAHRLWEALWLESTQSMRRLEEWGIDTTEEQAVAAEAARPMIEREDWG